MKYNYILGLDEADMKKIRGLKLQLVNFFFPSLIEVLKKTARNKEFYPIYRRRWLDTLEKVRDLMEDNNKLNLELNELQVSRDERLRKARTNHSMVINDYQVALQSEQEKNERLKKEIKALHKTIARLKSGNSNKPKNNEVERSIKVSGNER